MAYRATKSGFAAEAQNKIRAKYDEGLAAQCMEWIKQLIQRSGENLAIDTSGSSENFHSTLKDGYVLGRLANILKPGSISKAKADKRNTMAFKQMEMIGLFVEVAKGLGVPDPEAFQTVDLHEGQNLHQVVICLQALGRKAPSWGLPGFGPKESEENKRDFSEEQLKAGQGIIGLQMGTNKGANQAGQSFGKARMITD